MDNMKDAIADALKKRQLKGFGIEIEIKPVEEEKGLAPKGDNEEELVHPDKEQDEALIEEKLAEAKAEDEVQDLATVEDMMGGESKEQVLDRYAQRKPSTLSERVRLDIAKGKKA